MYRLSLLLPLLLILACADRSTQSATPVPIAAEPAIASPANQPGAATRCEDPRPEMCAQVYQPVCGSDAAGKRSTHGNACTACSDPQVLEHMPGACPQSEP